jgi:hypothetical protein
VFFSLGVPGAAEMGCLWTELAKIAERRRVICAGDTACQTACDAHCAGLGAAYQRLNYGCEGFCQGGINNDLACVADTDCPGGSCTGTDPPGHPGTCNCGCQAEGLGGASPAGSLSCQIGTQIDVELPTDGDCLDPNTIALAPVCGGLTTTTATGRIVDAAAGRVAVDGQEIVAAGGTRGAGNGAACSVALRPEAVTLDGAGESRNRMSGAIEEVSFLGAVVRIRVRFGENAVSLDTFNNPGLPPPARGETVTVSFAREDLLALDEAEAA